MKNEFTYEHKAPNRPHVVVEFSIVSVLKDGKEGGGKQSVLNIIISYLLNQNKMTSSSRDRGTHCVSREDF